MGSENGGTPNKRGGIQIGQLKRLYDAMVDGGYEQTYEEFVKGFTGNANYANRKLVYDTFKEGGADVGSTYAEFMQRLRTPRKETVPFSVSSIQATIDQTQDFGKRTDKKLSAVKRNPLGVAKTTLGFPSSSKPANKRVEEVGYGVTWNDDKPQISRRYADTDGYTYDSADAADWAQGDIDKREAAESAIARLGTEEDVRARLARAYKDRERISDEIDEEQDSRPWWQRVRGGSSVRAGLMRDEIEKSARSDMQQVEARISELEDALNTIQEMKAAAEDDKFTARAVSGAKQALGDGWLGRAAQWGAKKGGDTIGFFKGAGRGIADTLKKKSFYDAGESDARNASATLSAVRHAGTDEYTADERKLLDAAAYNAYVQGTYGSKIGRGYKAGGVTAESLPFMLEMILNPASGLGHGLQRKVMRNLVSKYGKAAVKKATKKYMAKKLGARAAGDLAAAATMTATTGQMRVAGDTMQRMTGEIQPDISPDGDIVFKGTEGAEDNAFAAYAKAFGAQTIENHSEMVGEYFAPLIGAAGKAAGRVLGKVKPLSKLSDKMRLSSVADFIRDVNSSNWKQNVDEILKRAKFNGTIGEYAEEVVGNIENALTVGDMTLDSAENTGVFNKDINIDTFLGVGLMSGFCSAFSVAGYRGRRREALRDLSRMDDAIYKGASPALATRWTDVREKLLRGTEEEATAALNSFMADESIPFGVRNAATKYGIRAQVYRGTVAAERKEAAEREQQRESAKDMTTRATEWLSDMQDAGDAGYLTEGAEGMNDAKNRLDDARAKVAQAFGINAEDVDGFIGDAEKWVTSHIDSAEEAALNAAMECGLAKKRFDGMVSRAKDGMEREVAARTAETDAMTNKDTGTIIGGTLRERNPDGTERGVCVIGGSVAFNADGTIDTENSAPSLIVVDRATGEKMMVSPDALASVDTPIDAAQEKARVADETRKEYAERTAGMIDGTADLSAGATYTLTDKDGNTRQVTVTADKDGNIENADGTVNVSADGGKTIERVSRDEIEQAADNSRKEATRQRDEEKKAAESQEAAAVHGQPRYGKGQTFVLADGTSGEIVDVDEDGGVVVNTEEPMADGRMSARIEKADFDAALQRVTDEDGNLYWERADESAADGNGVQAEGNTPAVAENGESVPEEAPIAPSEENAEAAAPAADTEETPQPEEDAMPMKREKDGRMTPDFSAATPEQTHRYVYKDSGLDREEADAFVEAKRKEAEAKAKGKSLRKPKMGTDIEKYKAEKARYEAAKKEAEAELAYWEEVKRQQDKVVVTEREEQRKKLDERVEAAKEQLAEDKRIAAEKAAEQAEVGTHAVNPKIKEKWDKSRKAVGNAHAVTLEDGTVLRGHYVLTEAGATTASHDVENGFEQTEGFPVDENGGSVNDRDYKRDADAQRRVREMADAYDGRALQSPVVVSGDGIVLSGNNRTMSGDLAARQGTDGAYVAHLKEYGAMYGFTPEQVDGMEHPRVVFVPDEALPYDAATFARFNAQDKKAQSKPEHAVKLGKVVPDNVFARIVGDISRYDRLSDYYADGAAANSALQLLLEAGVINEMELPALRTGNSLSAAGRELIENTLIGKVFQSSPDAVRQIISTPVLRQSVTLALGEIAHNRAFAASGYDLGAELGAAVDLVYRARTAHPGIYRDGVAVSPYGREQGLFDEEYGDSRVTDATVLLLADVLNSGKPSDLRKVFALYNNEAEAPASGQTDMFSGGLRSKEEILKGVNEYFRNATGKEQQDAVSNAVAERKRRAEEAVEAADADGSGENGEPDTEVRNGDDIGDGRQDGSEKANTDKITPVGESDFGFVYDQFKGNAQGAIQQLMKMQDGEALGALHHTEIGDIDLVWGKAGTRKSDGYGLAKLVKFHPEVLNNLQGILDSMHVIERSENRVQLENAEYQAAVRLTWNGEEKLWLLTAFKKKETSEPTNSRTDVDSNLDGKSDDTATRQSSDVSADKATDNAAPEQAAEGKSGENEESKGYTIAPATYTNKKGKTSDVHLLTFEKELTEEQGRAVNEFAKERTGKGRFAPARGWKDRESGGWMFRTEEDARKAAELAATPEAVADNQPLSAKDMRDAVKTDAHEEEDGGKNPAYERKEWTAESDISEMEKREKLLDNALHYNTAEEAELFPEAAAFRAKRDALRKKVAAGEMSEQQAGEELRTEYADYIKRVNQAAEELSDLRFTLLAAKDNQQRKEAEEAKAQRKKELERKHNGFLKGKTALQASSADKALEKAVRFGEEGAMTIAEYIEKHHAAGDLAFEKKPYDQPHPRRWNAMSGAEQRRWEETHPRKVDYVVNGYFLGKTAYDYAEFLSKNGPAPKDAPKSEHSAEGNTSETKAEQPKKNPSGNKLVTDERYEELKKRMRAKLRGQLNMGVDPEILAIGTEMAVYHIEKGARKFAEFAKDMIADLGEAVRPYLKAFYNGARDLPEMAEYAEGLTPYDEVRAFDTANFDKPSKDVFAQAEMVAAESKAEAEAEKAGKAIKDKRNERRKEQEKQKQVDAGETTAEQPRTEETKTDDTPATKTEKGTAENAKTEETEKAEEKKDTDFESVFPDSGKPSGLTLDFSGKGKKRLSARGFVTDTPGKPQMHGVHYDGGFAVASNGMFIAVVRTDYAPELEGKTVLANGETDTSGKKFPDWRSAVAKWASGKRTAVDAAAFIDAAKKAMAAQKDLDYDKTAYVTIGGIPMEAKKAAIIADALAKADNARLYATEDSLVVTGDGVIVVAMLEKFEKELDLHDLGYPLFPADGEAAAAERIRAANERRLREEARIIEELEDALGDVEEKWEKRIDDYILEHYPDAYGVRARTKEQQALYEAERKAMKEDAVLKKMHDDAKAEFDAVSASLSEARKQMEAHEYSTKEGTDTERGTSAEVEADEEITDVGEKIGGAKKDKFREMAEAAAKAQGESDATLSAFIAKTPLSKIFGFDLAKMRAGGVSNAAVSFIAAAKGMIPAKPRIQWKLRRWVGNVLTLYRASLEAFADWESVAERMTVAEDSGLKRRYDAYMAVGGYDSGLNTGKAGLLQFPQGSGAGMYGKNGEWISHDGWWYVSNAGKHTDVYKTREEAVAALRAFAGENVSAAAGKGGRKEIRFSVLRSKDGTCYITPQGKMDVVIQGGFATANEAFEYLDGHNAELQERYRGIVDGTAVTFGKNRGRKGRDWRAGRDVSADEFMKSFGFRGVEFGNWMKQEDRRKALNECYDALMDLADVCGVSPLALSLDGELGMAFGARGGGRFMAHYEPGKVVINLTKTQGAGSLAHEWFHAVDNYFAKMGGSEGYATSGHGMTPLDFVPGKDGLTEDDYPVRVEMSAAWEHLWEAIVESGYGKRSRVYAALHKSKYWDSPTEMGARAFSVWVENELSKRDATNDYLANNPKLLEDALSDTQKRYSPYPFNTDAEWMDEAFGNLFSTMQEKVDEETGHHILYRKADGAAPVSREEQALRGAVVDRLREGGIEVIDDVEEGQRVLDMANGTGVRSMSFGEPYSHEQYPLGRVESGLSEKNVGIVAADANHGFKNYKEAKDWAKRHIAKTYGSEETGGKGNVRVSNGAIDKFLSQSAVDKSDGKDVHMSVLKVLPEVLKTSVDVETHPDFLKGEDGKRNPENGVNKDVLVHRCYGAVDIDGKRYRVKITLKEDTRNANLPSNAYSYEATKIELLAGTLAKPESDSPNTSNSISAAKLLNGVEMSYNPGVKVLDASRERASDVRQQKVYHGSGADFNHFDHSHMGEGEGAQAYGWGTYVTEVEGIGRTYAEQGRKPVPEFVYNGKEMDFSHLAAELSDIAGIDNEHAIGHFLWEWDRNGSKRAKEWLAYEIKEVKGWRNHSSNPSAYNEKIAGLVALARVKGIRKNTKVNKTNLYAVEIPDDNGKNYLDWKKEYSENEVTAVIDRLIDTAIAKEKDGQFDGAELLRGAADHLASWAYEGDNGGGLFDKFSGENIYRKIAGSFETYSEEGASKLLSEAGFAGIKYPANNMRGGREDGKKNYVIFNEADAKITDHVRFFRTKAGVAYGYTVDGKIYIDPRIATSDTPIHEYAHLWASALRAGNAKEWQHVVSLMKGTDLWEEVRRNYPELTSDDEIADEVIAHYSGKRGAERLREEARKIAEGKGGVLEKAEAISALEKVKRALSAFWKGVADFLHIHYGSAEEVADRVMKDLLDGVDPRKFGRDNGLRLETGESETGKTRFALVGERGAANMDKAEEVATRLDNLNIARKMEEAKKNAKAIKQATGWERGADGKWRYEIPDIRYVPSGDADLNHRLEMQPWGKELEKLGDRIFDGETLTDSERKRFEELCELAEDVATLYRGLDKKYLADYVLADDLFKAYPKLRAVNVVFVNADTTASGSYSEKENTIYVNEKSWVSREEILAHEIQHAIQHIEGFARGGNETTPYDKYRRLSGEVEARNVQSRLGMTDEERRNSLASETEDVSREDQIFLFGDGGESASVETATEVAADESADEEAEKFRDGEEEELAAEADEEMRQAMTERVNELSGRLNTPVRVISTEEEIAALPNERQRRAKGWFDTRTGEVSIVLPNNADAADVENTFLHEVVGHDGLRVLFPEDGQLDNALDELYRVSESGIRERIDAAAREMLEAEVARLMEQKRKQHEAKGENPNTFYYADLAEASLEASKKRDQYRRHAAEEYAADLAGRIGVEGFEKMSAEEQTFWGRLKAMLQNALRRLSSGLGIKSKREWADKEWAYVLHEAYKRKKNGGRPSAFDVADTVVMRGKTGFGEANKEETIIDAVNGRFNEQLGTLTEENADNVVLSLGRPSPVLRAAGVEDKPMKLYGNKVTKKMRKHGFSLDELRDLPRAVADPIAVFDNYGKDGNRSILTELRTAQGKFLVTISLGKGKEDIDFNIVSSVFGKGEDNIVDWLNKGFATYINKEKALNYLHHSALRAVTSESPRLVSAAKVVKDFVNPKETGEKNADTDIMFRDGNAVEYKKAQARDTYERRVSKGLYQAREALQDSMLSLKVAMDTIMKAEGKKTRIEDIAGYENAYLGENRLSSVNQAECKEYARTLFKPLLEEVAKLASTADERAELTDYMMAKHGLERNKVMARRNAKRQAEEEFGEEISKVQRELEAHPDDDKLTIRAHELALAKAKREEEIYLADSRDYSGLTALTQTDSKAAAEAEAQRMVEEYEKAHDTDKLWRRTRDVTGATLEKCYDCGLISAAQYGDIRSMYKHYIPLRGFDEKTDAEVYAHIGDKRSGFASPIKTARGRKSKADDPFANMEAMMESAIMAGNRNSLVKQRFLNFVLGHPSDLVSVSDLWLVHDDAADEWKPAHPGEVADTERIEEDDTPEEVERKMREFEKRMKALAAEDPQHYTRQGDAPNVYYRLVDNEDLKQHQVVVKRNGKAVVLTINGNPRAAQALNGLTNPDNAVGGIAKFFEWGEAVNRQLSAFYTTRNPDFVVSNFVRDSVYANTMVWAKESPNYAARFNINWAKLNPAKMKALLAKLRDGTLDESNETEKMFRQFMLNGGETGYTSVRDIEKRKKDIAKELKKLNGQMPVGKALELLGERFDEINRAVENCARFAAFMTSRQMGRSIDRSIWDAKEVSVNFNKKGSGAKFHGAKGQTWLGNQAALASGFGRSFYVFWNAAVQGTTNFGRNVGRHPVKGLAGAAAMFALGMLAAGIGGGDDDDKDGYYNLPDYVRRSNIVFRAPGMDESWISIPLPVEYRALYGMGELAMSVMSGKAHYSVGELAHEMASQVSQMLPLDVLEGGGGVSAFVPSSVKPIAEILGNKSWTGLPIYKENDWNKDEPQYKKVYKNANKALVAASKWINEATGGDEYTSGWGDVVNPAVVEHLLNGYFGGVARSIGEVAAMGETLAGKREYDSKDFMFVNRLVKRGDERTEYRAVNNEYFRVKEASEKLRKRLRHYEEDTAKGVFDYAEKIRELNYSPDFRVLWAFEAHEPEIDAINEQLKEPTISAEYRKELETELNAAKRRLVDAVNEARGEKR